MQQRGERSALVIFLLVAACSSSKGRLAPPDAGSTADDSGVQQADVTSGAEVDGGDEATSDAGVSDDADDADDSGFCVPLPTDCPVDVPSYSMEVAPLLDARCNTCHMLAPGSPWPLTNYEDVRDWRTYLVTDLVHCTMPPLDGGTPLTPAEVDTVLTWLVCGTPDN